MDKNSGKTGARKEPEGRQARLKAALKANLQRRKEQARARARADKS